MIDNKKTEIQKALLEQMEQSRSRIMAYRDVLGPAELKLLEWVKECIEDKSVGPYKTVVMYSKMVESLYKMEQLFLQLYDRVTGTLIIPEDSSTVPLTPVDEDEAFDEEESEALAADLRFRRSIEMLALEMAEELYPHKTADQLKAEEEARKEEKRAS